MQFHKVKKYGHILLFALLITSSLLEAQIKEKAFSITPTRGFSNEKITLSLLSFNYNCGTTYSHTQVTSNDSEIVLSFLPTENANAICPAIYKPYGPQFTLPELKAKKYKVYASPLVPCQVQVPSVCKMAVPLVFVDTLTIEDRVGWFINPNTATPNQSFTLQLLNYDYENCQDVFTNRSAILQNGSIHANFNYEHHSEYRCITSITPWGPSFSVNGLKAGIYPVQIYITRQCPPDFLCPQVFSWITVDTLYVTEGLSVLASQNHLFPKIQIQAQGNLLTLTLPKMIQGKVSLEIYSLKGSRIDTYAKQSFAGSNTSFAWPLKNGLKSGTYILKMKSGEAKPTLQTFIIP